MMFSKAKPYFLTVFFGFGKVVSTIGSAFFALDKLVVRAGGDTSAPYNTTIRIITALSGGVAIALTRLPEMWKTYSNSNQLDRDHQNRNARFFSYIFSVLGYITALLTAISGYLSGRALYKLFDDDITGMRILGAYVGLCSYISFTVYSVKRVTDNAYDFGLLVADNRSNLCRMPDKITVLTALTSSACLISTATMFHYSIKHSIHLLLQDILGEEVLGDGQVNIIAYISIVPSEATLIFSQIAAVYKLLNRNSDENTQMPNGWFRKLAFHILNVLNLISVPLQGAIYYEYMYDYLNDRDVNPNLNILLSCINALSSAWIYYAFTANRATQYAKNMLTVSDLTPSSLHEEKSELVNITHASGEAAEAAQTSHDDLVEGIHEGGMYNRMT